MGYPLPHLPVHGKEHLTSTGFESEPSHLPSLYLGGILNLSSQPEALIFFLHTPGLPFPVSEQLLAPSMLDTFQPEVAGPQAAILGPWSVRHCQVHHPCTQ